MVLITSVIWVINLQMALENSKLNMLTKITNLLKNEMGGFRSGGYYLRHSQVVNSQRRQPPIQVGERCGTHCEETWLQYLSEVVAETGNAHFHEIDLTAEKEPENRKS